MPPEARKGDDPADSRTEFVEPRRGGDTVCLVDGNQNVMLCLTDVERPERHFEVPLRQKVTVGRGMNNRVVLDYDNSVSGTHCEIQADNGQLTIRDLNSRNGTYVDGIRVSGAAGIVSGSRIKLGRVTLRVEVR